MTQPRTLHILCPQCGSRQSLPALPPGHSATCYRCDNFLAGFHPAAQQTCLAFTLAALLLYLPANYYPVLSMTYLGRYSENTIWSGVMELYKDGMWGIALLVFVASMVVPLIKLLVMLYLLWCSRTAVAFSQRVSSFNHSLYRVVERIGPWSMLDVFLVAILVALVKLDDIARVSAGPGIVAFGGVVVLTMLASASFSTLSLWRPGNGCQQASEQLSYQSNPIERQ